MSGFLFFSFIFENIARLAVQRFADGFQRRETDGTDVSVLQLGKVDVGGGGTVAKYMANHNIDTIDIGVPVLSMHAPYEVVSKYDIYETYRCVKAFNEDI